MVHPSADDDPAAALEKLAAELTARGYKTPQIAPYGRPPSLSVTNPAAAMLTETVMVDAGWFWWPWDDPIAPMTDITAAADQVVQVLRTANGQP